MLVKFIFMLLKMLYAVAEQGKKLGNKLKQIQDKLEKTQKEKQKLEQKLNRKEEETFDVDFELVNIKWVGNQKMKAIMTIEENLLGLNIDFKIMFNPKKKSYYILSPLRDSVKVKNDEYRVYNNVGFVSDRQQKRINGDLHAFVLDAWKKLNGDYKEKTAKRKYNGCQGCVYNTSKEYEIEIGKGGREQVGYCKLKEQYTNIDSIKKLYKDAKNGDVTIKNDNKTIIQRRNKELWSVISSDTKGGVLSDGNDGSCRHRCSKKGSHSFQPGRTYWMDEWTAATKDLEKDSWIKIDLSKLDNVGLDEIKRGELDSSGSNYPVHMQANFSHYSGGKSFRTINYKETKRSIRKNYFIVEIENFDESSRREVYRCSLENLEDIVKADMFKEEVRGVVFAIPEGYDKEACLQNKNKNKYAKFSIGIIENPDAEFEAEIESVRHNDDWGEHSDCSLNGNKNIAKAGIMTDLSDQEIINNAEKVLGVEVRSPEEAYQLLKGGDKEELEDIEERNKSLADKLLPGDNENVDKAEDNVDQDNQNINGNIKLKPLVLQNQMEVDNMKNEIDLLEVDGVGQATAEKIQEAEVKVSDNTTVEDLTVVDGIGESTAKKIVDFVSDNTYADTDDVDTVDDDNTTRGFDLRNPDRKVKPLPREVVFDIGYGEYSMSKAGDINVDNDTDNVDTDTDTDTDENETNDEGGDDKVIKRSVDVKVGKFKYTNLKLKESESDNWDVRGLLFNKSFVIKFVAKDGGETVAYRYHKVGKDDGEQRRFRTTKMDNAAKDAIRKVLEDVFGDSSDKDKDKDEVEVDDNDGDDEELEVRYITKEKDGDKLIAVFHLEGGEEIRLEFNNNGEFVQSTGRTNRLSDESKKHLFKTARKVLGIS